MLLGRQVEQQALGRLLAGARLGRGGALAVTGEPGAGKTTLLGAALEDAGGMRVLRATGVEAEREVPFGALYSCLRPAVGDLDTIPAPQAEALGAAMALRTGTVGDRFAVGAATLSLLCRHAEDAPALIVLDDVQWMDRPSIDALTFAARRLDDDPVVMLLAGRSGEIGGDLAGLPALEVGGLDREAAGALVRRGTPCTDARLARLYEITAGNPLALQELSREPAAADRNPPGVPPTLTTRLQGAFARRLAVLDPAARTALLVAAVASGDEAVTAAACERLGAGDVDLAGAPVTVTAGTIVFDHPLVRAAAYSGAPPGERRRAHAVVADLVPDPDRRAWHLALAAERPDADVAALLVASARRSEARGAHAVASDAWERSARLSVTVGDRRDRLRSACAAAWTAGLHPRALGLLDELARDADGVPGGDADGGAVLDAATLRLRGTIAVSSGSLVAAREDLEAAARRCDDASQRVLVLAEAMQACLYLGDTRAARRVASALTAALRRTEDPLAHAVGLTAAGIAGVITGTGGLAELDRATELLAVVDPHEHPEAMPWQLLAPLFLRDATHGARLRALVAGERSRAGVGALPQLLFFVARDQATSAHWPRAVASYEESIALSRETGRTNQLALSLAGLAELDARRGRADDCRAHAEESLRLCTARGIRFAEAWCRQALGDLDLGAGRAEQAAAGLGRLVEDLAAGGLDDPDLWPAPELVDALLRCGERSRAVEVVARFAAVAEAKGGPWSLARSERARGLVAASDDIDLPFRRALEHHAATVDVFETARTRLAYGTRLRRAARRVDARPHLRAAVQTFQDLGAEGWAGVASSELEATGEKVARRDVTGRDALTPQELQVAALLAEGRTTRETAAALFLSPKTVEYHLRKVYTKLDIHSRAELAEVVDP
ncbi:AAA family ATPase [Isoptericola aurantiacus]|uniref:AAA family ATPase n=1 Tax=Isoptericola aurantiacus TaxID=3377839 RepID=UPI00383AFB7D